ncbi:hypothetical protein SEVIR_9G544801v4 [Setaria viridis]
MKYRPPRASSARSPLAAAVAPPRLRRRSRLRVDAPRSHRRSSSPCPMPQRHPFLSASFRRGAFAPILAAQCPRTRCDEPWRARVAAASSSPWPAVLFSSEITAAALRLSIRSQSATRMDGGLAVNSPLRAVKIPIRNGAGREVKRRI